MRALTLFGIFDEPEEEVYEHNFLSNAMSTYPLVDTVQPM
jgi:hypothetical protein